jgi:predicted DNA-binding protein (UPF0251 family)
MSYGRKIKVRYIQKMPKTAQFSPRGKAGRPDEIEIRVDQYEALKLADYQGYEQAEGAKFMGISRPTFGRLLREARKIVADAIVNGKLLRIRIGNVQVGVRQKDFPKRSEAGDIEAIQESLRRKIFHHSISKPLTTDQTPKKHAKS